jgi:hypothetical protein
VRIVWLCVAVVCAALVFPASAAAIRCAPPGNAGVDQYFETVPGSSCNRPSNGPGSGPGSGSQGSLPGGTRRQLAAQGPVGQAVTRLVSSNGANGSGSRSGANNGAGTALAASGDGTLSALLDPVLSGSSSGGVGVLLPVFLGCALVLALLAVAARRWFGSSGPES